MPNTINSAPWSVIEKHYIDLNEKGWKHEKLLELVQHIKVSSSSKRLFGYTSLDKLVIGNVQPLEHQREVLHVEFLRDRQEWKFCYFSQPYRTVELEKIYPSEKGIEKFEKFIKMLNW